MEKTGKIIKREKLEEWYKQNNFKIITIDLKSQTVTLKKRPP